MTWRWSLLKIVNNEKILTQDIHVCQEKKCTFLKQFLKITNHPQKLHEMILVTDL